MAFGEVLALVILVASVCAYLLHTKPLEWAKVCPPTITDSHVVSSNVLFYLRLLMGGIVWSSSLYILLDRDGLLLNVVDRHGEHKQLHLKHFGEAFDLL
jgi:hypothetical protein